MDPLDQYLHPTYGHWMGLMPQGLGDAGMGLVGGKSCLLLMLLIFVADVSSDGRMGFSICDLEDHHHMHRHTSGRMDIEDTESH